MGLPVSLQWRLTRAWGAGARRIRKENNCRLIKHRQTCAQPEKRKEVIVHMAAGLLGG